MKHDSFKTYLHWGLTAFGVVALSILFFFSLFKVGALVHFFQTLLGILMPFVYGLAMAYLLTPVFNWLHARFAPALQKHVKNPRRAARAAKFLSTTLSVLLALLAGIAIFFVRNFAQVLGESGQIPVVLAAWTPPVAALLSLPAPRALTRSRSAAWPRRWSLHMQSTAASPAPS